MLSHLKVCITTDIKYLRPRNTAEKSRVMRTGSDGQGSSLHFVAHLVDRFRGRPHKPHPSVGARLRKVRPLREKAVAWVDGVHVVFLNGSQNRRFTFALMGLVALPNQNTSHSVRASRAENRQQNPQLPSWTEWVISGSPNTICS